MGHRKALACTFLLTEASVVLVGRVPSMVPGGSSAGFLAPFVTPIYTGRGGRWKDSGRPRKPGNGECVGSGAEAGNGAGLNGWNRRWPNGLSAVTSGVGGPRSTGVPLGPPSTRLAAWGLGRQPGPRASCAVTARGDFGPGASPGSSARAALRLSRWCGDDGVGPQETIVTQ